MTIVIEEIVTEVDVVVVEEVVRLTISDTSAFLDLVDVTDKTYVGKDGYVPTVNETTGKLELQPSSGGGGAVDSVFNRTGAVVATNGDYNAGQITETGSKVFVTPSEKTAIAHANRSTLDLITEAFTTALKTAYDSAVTWIVTNGDNVISAYTWVTTNGANVLNHIASTSNPHNVTKSQVGLSDVQNVDTTTTTNINEGTKLFFTTARVLATVLSGLSTATGGTIVDTDTVLIAFGKLQNQINAVPGLITTALATFKTANFLDATSSIQTQLDAKAIKSTSAYSMKVNNTNATANETEVTFRQSGLLSYTETVAFTAGTAPSGTENKSYNWIQLGNLVTLNIAVDFANAGATVTQILFPMPSDLPDPVTPTGFSGASAVLYTGVGLASNTPTAIVASTSDTPSFMRRNSGNTDWEFGIVCVSGSTRTYRVTIQYFTA